MNAKRCFAESVATITARIAGRNLDSDLQSFLEQSFPPGGEAFDDVATLCRQGIDEGWLGNHEHGGIRYGRVTEPGPAVNDFSVDVVQMEDIAGPYHGHPAGEIDMIIPETAAAKFDGHGQGWLVYPAGSEHYPTVTGGKAIILYLLPGGKIDFTRTAP